MADLLRAEWPAPGNIVAGTTLRGGAHEDLLPGEPCWLHQVHGATVVLAGHFDAPPDADASVCRTPGIACVVRTADCLPVLFCATDGREIAAAHAGWRGLAAGIIEATVTTMEHDARDLVVWLGPAISQEAFEVGDEVRAAFVEQAPGDAAFFVRNDRDRWQADLYALARRRLQSLGIGSIHGGGDCTYADSERFYSYRRDPGCGRMVSFVAMESLEISGPGSISG